METSRGIFNIRHWLSFFYQLTCFPYIENVHPTNRKTGSEQIKAFAFGNNLVVIALLIMIFLMNGCASGPPKTLPVEINLSHEIIAPAKINKANVGIYYEPNIASYVHRQSISDSIAATDVDRKSVEPFNTAS